VLCQAPMVVQACAAAPLLPAIGALGTAQVPNCPSDSTSGNCPRLMDMKDEICEQR